MLPAVFMDRDGTINEQMGYVNHVSRFQLLPRTAAAIRLLNRQGIPAVIVSNQSGVGRGYFPETLLAEVHAIMHRLLKQQLAHVDGIYVCPHHPEAKLPAYRVNCDCRKPKTGLFDRAAREMGLDLSRSYVVGDRWSDLQAAINCRATPVLVLTGYGRGDLAHIGPHEKVQPRHIAEDLYGAIEWIIHDLKSGQS